MAHMWHPHCVKLQRSFNSPISAITAAALLSVIFLNGPLFSNMSQAATNNSNFYTNFTAFNPHTLFDSRIHRKVNPMVMKVASYLNYVYQEVSSNKVGVQAVIQDMKDTIENGFSGKLYFMTPMSKAQLIDNGLMTYSKYVNVDPKRPGQLDNAPQPSSFITVYDESDPKFPSLPYCYVDDRVLGVKRAPAEPVVVAIISGDCQAYIYLHQGIQNKYPNKFLPLYLLTPGLVDQSISASRQEDASDILHISATGEPIDVKLRLDNPLELGATVHIVLTGWSAPTVRSSFIREASQTSVDPNVYEYILTKDDESAFLQQPITCDSTKNTSSYWTLDYFIQTPPTGVGTGFAIAKGKDGVEMSGTLPVIILRDGCIA